MKTLTILSILVASLSITGLAVVIVRYQDTLGKIKLLEEEVQNLKKATKTPLAETLTQSSESKPLTQEQMLPRDYEEQIEKAIEKRMAKLESQGEIKYAYLKPEDIDKIVEQMSSKVLAGSKDIREAFQKIREEEREKERERRRQAMEEWVNSLYNDLLEYIKQQLGLTDSQIYQIKPIMEEYWNNLWKEFDMRTYRRGSGEERQALQQKLKNTTDEFVKKASVYLYPEQQQKLKQTTDRLIQNPFRFWFRELRGAESPQDRSPY